MAGVCGDARPWLRLRADGDRLSARARRCSGKPREVTIRGRSRLAVVRRVARGGEDVSRDGERAISDCGRQIGRRRDALAMRAGRRDDRVSRRAPAGDAARRDCAGRRRAAAKVSRGRWRLAWAARSRPAVSGTLYLRVNDSAARLGDNRGALTISGRGLMIERPWADRDRDSAEQTPPPNVP